MAAVDGSRANCQFSPFLDYDRLRIGLFGSTDLGRVAARAEHAQGTPTKSHISPSIEGYKDYGSEFKVQGDLSGRGSARAEDAEGTPAQSDISPSILVYKEISWRMSYITITKYTSI